MNKKDYRLFTDSDIIEPLPPIYKGKIITVYPGQLWKANNVSGGKFSRVGTSGSQFNGRMLGLRRYIFRYEGDDNFVYLATRKGQRNGGFNSKPSQSKIEINFEVPGLNNPVSNTFSFTEINDDNEEIWTSSLHNRVKYNALAGRWEWQTRPVPVPPNSPPGQFFINAYTQATSNPLKNTGSENQIQWTYIFDPWDTATPEVPVFTDINSVVYYNNNSVENLNKWPIRNIDADNERPGQRRKWQIYTDENSTFVPDRRPEGLSNDYLKKCFQGVNLKHYDIVFVEVMWRYFSLRDPYKNDGPTDWGYSENAERTDIHDLEWWSPKPFKTKRQKGRVYRIGGLEADTGIGGLDKVIWAQRTRVITTDYRRGGETALE